MTDKTTLGDRMKQYEAVARTSMLRRTPVIIRVDGRAFHTFTKRIVPDQHLDVDRTGNRVCDMSMVETPFSVKLHNVMNATAAELFEKIQNAVFVYTQSDEISIVLRDWDRHETQQWFGGNVQKMCSVSASIATAAFNYHFTREFQYEPQDTCDLAHFDSRAFNVPKEEVVNYFIWRQQDAIRNSIQMYGRHFFSPKQMHGKSGDQVQDMLRSTVNKDWEDLPTWMRRGSCVYARTSLQDHSPDRRLVIDNDIPVFAHDRLFIEHSLKVNKDDDVRI